MDEFLGHIYNWYKLNKRNLPWRNTSDPYKIWVSEIILQQTRVAQGEKYYLNFIETFPTVFDMANASEDHILKLWQGLGYYSRARNMHFTAKIIVQNYGGVFPQNHAQLLTLKGVGEYTAAAIASIAFDLPIPAVDGNIYRVFSRFFGCDTPIDTTKGKKEFYSIARSLLPKTNPGVHNQALMEFGALQCIPAAPDCRTCPVNPGCFAFNNNKIKLLPVKSKKTKISTRYFYFYFLKTGNYTYIEKRTKHDIWKNLYQFPVYESKMELNDQQLISFIPDFLKQSKIIVKSISNQKKHILSHQIIYARLIEAEIPALINTSTSIKKINKKDIYNFAFPKLMERFLNETEI